MKRTILALLSSIFCLTALAQEPPKPIAPPKMNVRADLLAPFEAELRSSSDTNLVQFRQFEELLVAQGFSHSQTQLWVEPKVLERDETCDDALLGESERPLIPNCTIAAFHFVKKMSKGNLVRFIVGNGGLQMINNGTRFRQIEMEYQGVAPDARHFRQYW